MSLEELSEKAIEEILLVAYKFLQKVLKALFATHDLTSLSVSIIKARHINAHKPLRLEDWRDSHLFIYLFCR